MIRQKAPELLAYNMETRIFPSPAGGPEAMAKQFGVPFLGRLPLDEMLTAACEEGRSYLEDHPKAHAATALTSIVQGIEARLG